MQWLSLIEVKQAQVETTISHMVTSAKVCLSLSRHATTLELFAQQGSSRTQPCKRIRAVPLLSRIITEWHKASETIQTCHIMGNNSAQQVERRSCTCEQVKTSITSNKVVSRLALSSLISINQRRPCLSLWHSSQQAVIRKVWAEACSGQWTLCQAIRLLAFPKNSHQSQALILNRLWLTGFTSSSFIPSCPLSLSMSAWRKTRAGTASL